jgi:hypothetical protein
VRENEELQVFEKNYFQKDHLIGKAKISFKSRNYVPIFCFNIINDPQQRVLGN